MGSTFRSICLILVSACSAGLGTEPIDPSLLEALQRSWAEHHPELSARCRAKEFGVLLADADTFRGLSRGLQHDKYAGFLATSLSPEGWYAVVSIDHPKFVVDFTEADVVAHEIVHAFRWCERDGNYLDHSGPFYSIVSTALKYHAYQ